MGPPGAVDREFGYIVFSPPLSPLPFGSHPSKSHTYVCMLFLSQLLDEGGTRPPADANTGAVSRQSQFVEISHLCLHAFPVSAARRGQDRTTSRCKHWCRVPPKPIMVNQSICTRPGPLHLTLSFCSSGNGICTRPGPSIYHCLLAPGDDA